jgi:hypothetical protein
MSEKRNVPTFRVFLTHCKEPLEGPIVSPDKQSVAKDLPEIHQILQQCQALLIYDSEWVYLPVHSVYMMRRGKHRFDLPLPLV